MITDKFTLVVRLCTLTSGIPLLVLSIDMAERLTAGTGLGARTGRCRMHCVLGKVTFRRAQ